MKLKKKIGIWALSLATGLLGAGAAGAQESHITSPLDEFTAVKIAGRISVTLVKAEENSLDVTLTDLNPKKFQFSVKDGTLQLRLSPVPAKMGNPARAVLKYRELTDLQIDGAMVVNQDVMEAGMLTVKLTSGATASLNLKTDDVTVEVSGANSKITLAGQSEYLTAKASMGGIVNGLSLDCLYANAGATMGAECYVWATRRLEAKAATKAQIYYKGVPELLKVSTNTLGEVSQMKTLDRPGEQRK